MQLRGWMERFQYGRLAAPGCEMTDSVWHRCHCGGYEGVNIETDAPCEHVLVEQQQSGDPDPKW